MARAGIALAYQVTDSKAWQQVFIPQALAQKAAHQLSKKKHKKLLDLCKKKKKTKEETKKIMDFAAKRFDVSRTEKVNLLGDAANEAAKTLYPEIQTKDADSVLIAEYARRKFQNAI